MKLKSIPWVDRTDIALPQDWSAKRNLMPFGSEMIVFGISNQRWMAFPRWQLSSARKDVVPLRHPWTSDPPQPKNVVTLRFDTIEIHVESRWPADLLEAILNRRVSWLIRENHRGEKRGQTPPERYQAGTVSFAHTGFIHIF